MKFRLMFGALAILLLTVGIASAAVQSAAEFIDIVDQRAARGELTADEALLLKFQYCFDRDKLPADLRPVTTAPMKSATGLIVEYLRTQDRMPSHIADAIEGYIAAPSADSRLEYFSDSGLFRVNYYTSGPNSVPLADANSNGIPDYVERVAEYMDYSYEFECVTLGFQSPPFQAAGGYMSVFIAALDGVYGFCTPLSSPPGMTRITVDNDFVGFPPNDDPDGDALGAAKVTCAHEFKHSSQYTGSYWSEGGWVEVDAVWMEEMAFPETNDYLNYLSFGSPISNPNVSLDGGSTGTGSYEDCVWQIYMSDKFGPQIIVDLWEHRKTHRSEPMMDSYETILLDYGQDLVQTWNEFTKWNFATGIRALATETYYHEADIYPAGSPQHSIFAYPTTKTGSVAHLAANFVRGINVASAGQRVEVTFNGADNARMTLAAVINESYGDRSGAFYEIPLDANNDAVFVVPYDLDNVYSVGFVIGNAAKDGPSQSYSITVDRITPNPTAVDQLAPAFAFAGNYPNPFNPQTSIEFTLNGTADTRLDIYDISGRRVRTLLNNVLDAGEHAVTFNGRDDVGRELASGTYLAKLRSGDQVTTHKLVLAK